MRRLLLAAPILVLGQPLYAAETCVTLDNTAVAALFDDWNFALSSLDAKQVAQRYWPDAVMMPASSNSARTDAASITSFYDQFLVKRPRGHIDSRTIQTGCNMALDTGTYTFSLMNDKGTTTNETARYTFIYQYRDGAWKILNQQASVLVDPAASAATDAQIAAAEAAKLAKLAAATPPPPKPRRAKLKDYLDDVPVARAKPKAKPAAAPVVAENKPAVEAKAPADAKAAADAKATPEAKPLVDAKTAADAKAPADKKSGTDAKATAEVKAAVEPRAVPGERAAPLADGKTPPEVRTAMFANLTMSPSPSQFYPPESMKRKERGNVNLKVCANGEGTVSDNIEVVKSSGSKLLDEAAMTWARAVTWVPATYNRQRVEGCAKVDVAFEPLPALANSGI